MRRVSGPAPTNLVRVLPCPSPFHRCGPAPAESMTALYCV